jgi:hypothetical protein
LYRDLQVGQSNKKADLSDQEAAPLILPSLRPYFQYKRQMTRLVMRIALIDGEGSAQPSKAWNWRCGQPDILL